MKRILNILLLSLATASTIVLGSFVPVSAVNVFGSCQSNSKLSNTNICQTVTNQTSENPIAATIGSIIQILTYVAGVLAIIMMLFSAYRYSTSSGDPNKVGQAKQTLTYALIGIVVVLASESILLFVFHKA